MDLIFVAIVVMGLLTLGRTIFKIFEKRFERFFKRKGLNINILRSLERPVYFSLIFGGLQISLIYTKLIPVAHEFLFKNISSIIWTLIISYALIKFFNALLGDSKRRKIGKGVAYLLKKLTKILIIFIAFIIILKILNVEITPLLASLGIAGLAIAFGLKDTLENFFAGMYLAADRPIRPGDYIEIDQKIRGKVLDIGWRSTKIINPDNNEIIIPNRIMGNSIVTNFNLPHGVMRTEVNVDVAYGSDADKVEKILYKTAKKIRDKMEECIKEEEPIIRFFEFGSSGLKFKIFLKVTGRSEQFAVGKELRKAIYKEFKKNKIEIPFTTHTVHLKK